MTALFFLLLLDLLPAQDALIQPLIEAAQARDIQLSGRRADLQHATYELDVLLKPSCFVPEISTGTVVVSNPHEAMHLTADPSFTVSVADPLGTVLTTSVAVSAAADSETGLYPAFQLEQPLENIFFPREDLAVSARRQAVAEAETAIRVRETELSIAVLGFLRDWASAEFDVASKRLALEGVDRDLSGALKLKTYAQGSLALMKLEYAVRGARIALKRSEMALVSAKAVLERACGISIPGNAPSAPTLPIGEFPGLSPDSSYAATRSLEAFRLAKIAFEQLYGALQPSVSLFASVATAAGILQSSDSTFTGSGGVSLGVDSLSLRASGGWDGKADSFFLSLAGSWKPDDPSQKEMNRLAVQAELLSKEASYRYALASARDDLDYQREAFALSILELDNLSAALELADLDAREKKAMFDAGIASGLELDTALIARESARASLQTATWNRVMAMHRLALSYNLKELEP